MEDVARGAVTASPAETAARDTNHCGVCLIACPGARCVSTRASTHAGSHAGLIRKLHMSSVSLLIHLARVRVRKAHVIRIDVKTPISVRRSISMRRFSCVDR